MVIIPGQISTAQLHHHLLGAVAPRPICFASTVDVQGKPNLSPYSFFNVFGSNPATLIFSPSRRVRNNTIKHTLENVMATNEVVINLVTYAMVQQTSLSSGEYDRGVDEFEKAGFTKLPALHVKPYRVAESPVQIECTVRQIIPTGDQGGAGTLVICNVVAMHINDAVLDANQQIDPHKIDLVARMGLDYYCRASGQAVFEVEKPGSQVGIGFNGLPPAVRNSSILSGNNLGQLASVPELPTIDPAFSDDRVKQIVQYYGISPTEMEQEMHHYAKQLLNDNKVAQAWQVLLT
ncbi:MAG: flavin reductase family protein [Bacteroidetes bacterium]|nr:MAG: flavin reductase family protein [Bacteroidota bacterium]